MTDTPIKAGWQWLLAHERLIIVALVLAVGAFGISKYFDVSAARADARAVAAQQQAVDAKANTAAATLQASQTASQYQAMVEALTRENAALALAVTSRNTVLQQNTAKKETAPLPELMSRWNTLAGTDVTVKGADAIVSDTSSRKTVNLLEQVPVLQANLTDETTIAANRQAELEKSDVLANNLNVEIGALNNQLTADAKACTLNIAAVKADGKKNSVKWFKRGLIVGFLGGLFVGHAAGL